MHWICNIVCFLSLKIIKNWLFRIDRYFKEKKSLSIVFKEINLWIYEMIFYSIFNETDTRSHKLMKAELYRINVKIVSEMRLHSSKRIFV